jgi:hypothetical protein
VSDATGPAIRYPVQKVVTARNSMTLGFKVLAELQKAHSKSYLDLNNIETLFGALEMARINLLSNFKPEEIQEFRQCLVLLIVRTLEESISFTSSSRGIEADDSYNNLVELLKAKGFPRSSIITFNYDVAADVAFYINGVRAKYCLENNEQGDINLLKLHGSINWVKEANSILPFNIEWILNNPSMLRNRGDKVNMLLSKNLGKIAAYRGASKFEALPVIVPPTWNKSEYHGTLTNVWTEAAKNLSTARNIYVFGYSLPETDSFFRYLYSLGTISDARIRRFWVFDPYPEGVSKRFAGLLEEE